MRVQIFLAIFVASLVSQAVNAAPPNVVIILADDLGINDLACYGRSEHNTPHLDQLAREGIRFTNAYCGLSICSASRAAIMTGKSPARLNLTTFLPGRPDAPTQQLLQVEIQPQLPLEEVTLAERFKKLGYITGLFGKWHLGNRGFQPKDQGFDESFQPPSNSAPSETEGGKSEYAITQHAIEFIDQHKSEPFFCYVAHHSPHIRLAAKPELIEKNKGKFNPVYAAMIETLDDTVGQILDTLKKNDLVENTIVVFASDNGGLHVLELNELPTHNSPFRAGKGYLYEGGLRVPLIIRWPGQIRPRVTDVPTVNCDFTPTFMELCGGTITESLDGVSIANLLLNDIEPPKRVFPFHFPHYTNQGSRPAGALRDGQWKLIEYYDDGTLELYDLSQDIGEQHDLSSQQPERTAAMRKQLADWRESVNARMNPPNPRYDRNAGERIYLHYNSSRFLPLETAVRSAPLQEDWRKLMDQAVARPKK